MKIKRNLTKVELEGQLGALSHLLLDETDSSQADTLWDSAFTPVGYYLQVAGVRTEFNCCTSCWHPDCWGIGWCGKKKTHIHLMS